MNTKSKSILALLGTLIIGMILGALLSGIFVRSRMKQFKDPERRAEHHKRRLHDFSDANEDQRAKIDAVFDSKKNKMHQFEEEFRANRKKVMDEIIEEISSDLTPDQVEKLKNRLKKSDRDRK